MATKTISITDEAYGLLARNKRAKESFSQEITRLMKKKGSILDLAGAWKTMSDKEAQEILETVKQTRKRGVSRV